MGTISHHQAKAHEFLNRADRAITNRNPRIAHDPLILSSSQDPSPSQNLDPSQEAAAALRRAASHATTALAVNAGWKHKSRRQLETVLHAAISGDTLSRSHLKTFRQVHTLSQLLSLRAQRGNPAASTMSLRGAKRRGNPAPNPPAHTEPVHPCQITLRRLRRRVAALIKAAAAIIDGHPKRVHYHKRWQRDADLPIAPTLTHIRDITRLPNFLQIQDRFRLGHIALAAMPDPHNHYSRGDTPRRCQCHPELWNRPEDPNRITLAPPWREALEKTFRMKIPKDLQLAC